MAAPAGSGYHDGGPPGPREILTRSAPSADALLRYGSRPDQVADLRLPGGGQASDGRPTRARDHGARPQPWSPGGVNAAPIVLFLHGGFWRTEYDRSHTGPLAAALAAAGYAVCVPEFRRASRRSSGWPGTFDDVAAAVDRLPGIVAAAAAPGQVNTRRVLLAGHSAGGHLALWAAARHRLPADAAWHTPDPRRFLAVVGLGAVSDLTGCNAEGLGDGAAAALMGGPPDRFSDRYAAADPARLLPLGVPVWLLHGTEDDRVPPRMSRAFASRARAAGDDVVLCEVPGCEHFGLVDPLSPAWPLVLGAFAAAARS